MNTIGISVISNRTHITLLAEDILYLSLSGRKTVIHVTGNRIYETYTPIDELEKTLEAPLSAWIDAAWYLPRRSTM